MSDILIFAGTTEGRLLAEFCLKHGIHADISAATDYGGSLLPSAMAVRTGRLDAEGITTLLRQKRYTAVVDATHPYAVDVTRNIRIACETVHTPYHRLLRDAEPVVGEAVTDIQQMTALLNQTNGIVLSTLGSKSTRALTEVRNYSSRIWLRMLPSEGIRETCTELGFREDHLILQRGPFDTAQNISHIRQSGAEILITKESGKAGGYPEKTAAVNACGIRMITLCRPPETGCTFAEIATMLLQLQENSL